MTTTYTATDRATQAKIDHEARHLSNGAVHDYKDRVLARLKKAPRFQSLGRKSYVYVEDIAQIMEEELGEDSE